MIRNFAREEGVIVPEHSSASDKGEQQPAVLLSAHAQALQRAVQQRDRIFENEEDMEEDVEEDAEDEGNDALVVPAEQPRLDFSHAELRGWHTLFSPVVGQGKSGNGKWKTVCNIPSTKHEPGMVFDGFKPVKGEGANRKQAVRSNAMTTHIERNHSGGLGADFWNETYVDELGVPDAKEFAFFLKAKRENWSLVDFVSAWDEIGDCTWRKNVLALIKDPPDALEQAKKRSRQSSLLGYLDSGKKTKKGMMSLYGACVVAEQCLSFNLFESRGMRSLLEAAGLDDASLPTRSLIRNAVDALYDFVIGEEEALLQKAPGFSLVFDGWTPRSGQESYVGLMYSYCTEDMVPRQVFLDLIPFGTRKHCAWTVAVAIAERIEQHTLPSQFLYGAVTDNAANVVKAAKLLVQDYESRAIGSRCTRVRRRARRCKRWCR